MLFRRSIKISTITTHCIALILGGILFRITDRDNLNNDRTDAEHETEYETQTLPINSDGSPNVPKIMDNVRAEIREELKNYRFTTSGVEKIDDLVLESGGNPLRSVIVSTWRSGSTFLGEILNAMPGTFYHYEPLRHYEIQQIRGPPHAENATKMLKSMLECNYDDMTVNDYFKYKRNHLQQFKHNTRMSEYCELEKELCLDGEFTKQFCKMFPFQSMKLVRYRLRLVEGLISDEKLNVKVVLEIRDPRAVLQSRHHHTFCPPAPDCWDPALVCSDMVSDYRAARRLMQQYPNRLIVVRYEELALNPRGTSLRLYSFLGLNAIEPLDNFLKTHTTKVQECMSSTYRKSRENAFKWKKLLDFDYVNSVQMSCTEAMRLWGYQKANNATHMASADFNPLSDYKL